LARNGKDVQQKKPRGRARNPSINAQQAGDHAEGGVTARDVSKKRRGPQAKKLKHLITSPI